MNKKSTQKHNKDYSTKNDKFFDLKTPCYVQFNVMRQMCGRYCRGIQA